MEKVTKNGNGKLELVELKTPHACVFLIGRHSQCLRDTDYAIFVPELGVYFPLCEEHQPAWTREFLSPKRHKNVSRETQSCPKGG